MSILPNNQSVVQLSYQRVAASAVTATQAIRTTTSGQVQPTTTNLRTSPFDGIALNSASTGQIVYVSAYGPLDPTTFNLGDGYACAVGTTVAGFPVRATDPTCVSAPNWLGHCDAYGNITITPRRETEFNVLDWGLDPTGVISCDTVFQTLLNQTTSGDIVYFPRGTYKFLEGITMPRPQMGITIRGQGGGPSHAIFPPLDHTILFFSNASGDGIRVCTDPTTNSHGFLTIQDLVLHQSNAANRLWNSEATESWLKGGAAIGMIGGQRLEVLGVEFTGEWRFGIACDGGEQCKFEDVDCRNYQSPEEVDGYQSFGIWLADANRGMSVSGATNVFRMRRIYGNAPAFLFLLDASVANTISDTLTNITPACIAGVAMVRGASYISFKNGYAEGDNSVGAAMFYFCGGQSVNFRIEGGFYTGVGVAFAHLGASSFSVTPGQAAGLQIVGVDLACDWIVNSNYITNNHISLGNLLSGDIASIRSNQMYDVEPGHTTGLIANTGQGNGYAMGTAGNPKAQHHWALKQYTSALHIDGTEPYRFREFWVDAISRFRTLETPYSAITGFRCQNDRAIEYVYTEDDGYNVDAAALVVGNRVMGTVVAQVEAVWSGDETKTASWKFRQKYRRNEGGDITLVGSATVIWSDADAGGVGFTSPDFSVDTATQTIRVNVKSRTDGQVYYLVNSRAQGVHP